MAMEITTQDWLRFFKYNPSSANEIVSFARTLYDRTIYSKSEQGDSRETVVKAFFLNSFKCAARYFHVPSITQGETQEEELSKEQLEKLSEKLFDRYSPFLSRGDDFIDLHEYLFDAIHFLQCQRLAKKINDIIISDSLSELTKRIFENLKNKVVFIYSPLEEYKKVIDNKAFDTTKEDHFTENDRTHIDSLWSDILEFDTSKGLNELKQMISSRIDKELNRIRDNDIREQKRSLYEQYYKTEGFFATVWREINPYPDYLKNHIKYAAYDMNTPISQVFEDLCNGQIDSDNEIMKGLACISDPDNVLLVEKTLRRDSYSMESLQNQDHDKIREYLDLLMSDTNVILQGAPGVGKTFLTQQIKDYFEKRVVKKEESTGSEETCIEWDSERTAFVTFHQSMDYEDFVEGIHAETKNGSIEYSIEDGIFKRICRKASTRPNEKFLLIIDEINRGNVSKIFGELITLLEQDKREWGNCPIHATLPYSKETFIVPSNLYILGTMNTTDRSVGNIDYALRRRFTFRTIPSNRQLLKEKCNESSVRLFDAVKKFIEANKSTEIQSTDDIMVGHSYFMKDNDKSLDSSWKYKIRPLLEEYINDGLLTKDAREVLTQNMDMVDFINKFN